MDETLFIFFNESNIRADIRKTSQKLLLLHLLIIDRRPKTLSKQTPVTLARRLPNSA